MDTKQQQQESLQSSTESEIEDESPIKKPRQYYQWTRIQCFETAKDALEFVKGERLWRRSGANYGLQGRKISYNCKVSSECSAKLYILFKSDSPIAELYSTTSIHTHAQDSKSHGIAESTKNKIIQLLNDGITRPMMILSQIRECGLVEPSTRMLTNFLSYHRRKQGDQITRSASKHSRTNSPSI